MTNNKLQTTNYQYQIGGSLPIDAPTYVRRQADEDLYHALKAGEFCYVLNSRQMGKSSLRVRTMQQLQAEGFACAAIDITAIGTADITSEEWYAGVIDSIVSSLELYEQFDLDDWWENNSRLSNVNRFSKFIEEFLLKSIAQKLVIFVDEIDSILSLNFDIDDFFAVIRDCYNKRADNQDYQRLAFVLIGVATPSDLIQDKRRTPFNIGRAIELTGLSLEEAEPLSLGLAGKVSNPQAVLQAVLEWTGGQPFLTQKLCKLVVQEGTRGRGDAETRRHGEKEDGEDREDRGDKEDKGDKKTFPIPKQQRTNNKGQTTIPKIVRSHIIENWERQDEPEHLRTIRDRLLFNEQRAGRLLGIYQQILTSTSLTPTLQDQVTADASYEQMELRLSGLVVEQQGKLRVYNPIYQEVFNQTWVEHALADLRPYAEAIAAWLTSNCEDKSRLLRGQALQDAQAWAADKSLSDQDYQFLAASQELAKRDVQIALDAERQAKQILAQARRKVELALEEEKQANQRLAQAQRQAKGQMRIGAAILAISLFGATAAVVVAGKADLERKSVISEREQASKERDSARLELKEAKQSIEVATEAEKAAQQALVKANQQQQQIEAARYQATQKAQQASEKLNFTKTELTKLGKEAQQKAQEVENVKQQVTAATEKLQTAQQQTAKAQQAAVNAQKQRQQAQAQTLSAQQAAVNAQKQRQQAQVQAQAAENKLHNAQQELGQKTRELDQLEANLNQTQTNLNQAQGQLNFIQKELAESIVDVASNIEQQTGEKPAVIYVSFFPTQEGSNSGADDQLGVWLFTAKNQQQVQVSVRRPQVLKVAQQFSHGVGVTPHRSSYVTPAKQLYEWIIKPLEADLQKQGITNLVFLMDINLRSLPLAALYDGHKFLVEKYSIGLMPGLTLTNTHPRNLKNAHVLAMGMTEAIGEFPALPFVEEELSNIMNLWSGKSFLKEELTLENLKLQRQQQPFEIIHLATHADFTAGKPDNSYIQLWDSKLKLSQLEQLGWYNPPVELLVLSACRTGVGDSKFKFGFAGKAIQAGVKSVLASLWYVSDEGTMVLMSEFYNYLRTAPIKAEALRQTQISMLREPKYQHPYYWAGFTMIGNPW
ncbi:MAG: CHAT domain-containing protein [Symploca sp. SIO2C1]|nr:CHAT domain-containing protein [Symploca sp. SIO2C1]